MSDSDRLHVEAIASIRALMVSYSPGDEASMDRADSATELLDKVLVDASYYVDGTVSELPVVELL